MKALDVTTDHDFLFQSAMLFLLRKDDSVEIESNLADKL